jgi:hypothetical protein
MNSYNSLVGRTNARVSYHWVTSPLARNVKCRIIIIPATLFATIPTNGIPDQKTICRLILSGYYDGRNAYPEETLNEARLVCQCTLAATVFDGVLTYLFLRCQIELTIVYSGVRVSLCLSVHGGVRFEITGNGRDSRDGNLVQSG